VQQHAYSVLLAEPEFSPGEAVWEIAERLTGRGLSVTTAQTREELRDTIAADSGVGAVLLDWELVGSGQEFHAAMDEIQDLGAHPPVALFSEAADERSVREAAAERTDGVFWLPADSPSYVAGQVERLVAEHAERLMTQFLAELTGFADTDEWICCLPGPDGELSVADDPSRCLVVPAQENWARLA
jgi:hypothetical protein